MNVIELIKLSEGCRLEAYRDSLGYYTIGYGHQDRSLTPSTVWTQPLAEAQLIVDIASATSDAHAAIGEDSWALLTEARRGALIDLAFNLGYFRLTGFREMLAAMRLAAWNDAAAAMLDSLAEHEERRRIERDAEIMRTGEWPAALNILH